MMPMNTEKTAKWPRFHVEVLEVLACKFERAGMGRKVSGELAETVVDTLAQYFGGRSVYLARGGRHRLATRDWCIWRDFNGTNTRELSEAHRLTTTRIYQIIKEQRELIRSSRFGIETAEVADLSPDNIPMPSNDRHGEK